MPMDSVHDVATHLAHSRAQPAQESSTGCAMANGVHVWNLTRNIVPLHHVIGCLSEIVSFRFQEREKAKCNRLGQLRRWRRTRPSGASTSTRTRSGICDEKLELT